MNQNLLIIPHYNNNLGLLKSITSIGEHERLDVIIVDDGSTTNKINESAILDSKSFNGEIIFNYFEENKGIEHALNCGIDYGIKNHYTYLSRLDCGDICVENRFKIQEDFLKNNPAVGLVGSHVKAVDENGNFLFPIRVPIDENKITKRMLLGAMFIHPTVMFRADVIKKVGNYPINYKAAEDFAFFTNILKQYKGANINDFLVTIELNTKGISIKSRKIQSKSRINILKDNYKIGLYSTYGLIRSYILYFLPYSLIQQLKKIIYK